MPLPAKLQSLLDGARSVVTHDELVSWEEFQESNRVRTCLNRKRVGTLDVFVAWVIDDAKPTDLTFDPKSGYATGSA